MAAALHYRIVEAFDPQEFSTTIEELLTDGWLLITGGIGEQGQIAGEIERLDAGSFERQVLNVAMQEQTTPGGGAAANVATIMQNGAMNAATQMQNGSGHSAMTVQAGSNNVANISQSN